MENMNEKDLRKAKIVLDAMSELSDEFRGGYVTREEFDRKNKVVDNCITRWWSMDVPSELVRFTKKFEDKLEGRLSKYEADLRRFKMWAFCLIGGLAVSICILILKGLV